MITTEQRKTEQYAAITESGRLARQIYELQAERAPVLEIANLIERRAQLEVDIFRIGGEINTEVMTANLITFLKVGEANHAELKTLMEETGARLGKIEHDLRGLSKRHGTQIKILVKDIAAIKVVMAARPAERAADQKRLEERLSAMEKRLAALEALADGNV